MLIAASTLQVVMIAVVFIALPVGALMFALGGGRRFDEIGKGDFAMDHDLQREAGVVEQVSPAVREEEIRQMIQARSDRGIAKGRKPLDVDAEVERVLAADSPGPGLREDKGLREEVRQLVVARNERRERQGKEPLDVEQEIERQLRELENLGQ